MSQHNRTGLFGEILALKYFIEKGYTILHQNWRYTRWEVDIIAQKDNILHFIEVKTRRTKNFGFPEENADKKKLKNLINAAEEYLYQQPQWKRIQFNILSIIINKDDSVEYFLIEDVYL